PLVPRPEPVSADPPPIEGGGGTTFPASRVPPGPPVGIEAFPTPRPAREGGGGTTLVLRAALDPPGRSLAPGADTDGGGGTTFVASAAPVPFGALRALAEVLPPLTLGGGGTTSVVPKILPTRLLIKPPLLDGVGGGGTTDSDGSATLPEASRRKSRDMSVDGGGAITEGDGIVSFAAR